MPNSYTIYTLHAQIRDIEPPVWRQIQVDGNITLRKLHHILQAAFGWTDSHLHDFEIDGRTYAMGDNDNMLELFAEDPEMLDDRKARLHRLAYPGHRFLYRYDFGDDWHHDIHVGEVTRTDPLKAASIARGARRGNQYRRVRTVWSGGDRAPGVGMRRSGWYAGRHRSVFPRAVAVRASGIGLHQH
jgi:hypothetical protein